QGVCPPTPACVPQRDSQGFDTYATESTSSRRTNPRHSSLGSFLFLPKRILQRSAPRLSETALPNLPLPSPRFRRNESQRRCGGPGLSLASWDGLRRRRHLVSSF